MLIPAPEWDIISDGWSQFPPLERVLVRHDCTPDENHAGDHASTPDAAWIHDGRIWRCRPESIAPMRKWRNDRWEAYR